MGFEQLGRKLMNLGQDAKSGVQKVGETYQVNNKLNDEKKSSDKAVCSHRKAYLSSGYPDAAGGAGG